MLWADACMHGLCRYSFPLFHLAVTDAVRLAARRTEPADNADDFFYFFFCPELGRYHFSQLGVFMIRLNVSISPKTFPTAGGGSL